MDWIFNLPAFIKVIAAFVSILVINRFGMNLGLSILIHSILLVFASSSGSERFLFWFKGFLQPSNLLLFLTIFLLLFFTESLRTTGRMEKTVESLKGWLKNRKLLFSSLPALIGLLPMPGGALFSAPLVDSIDKGKELSPSHKAAINYWSGTYGNTGGRYIRE